MNLTSALREVYPAVPTGRPVGTGWSLLEPKRKLGIRQDPA